MVLLMQWFWCQWWAFDIAILFTSTACYSPQSPCMPWRSPIWGVDAVKSHLKQTRLKRRQWAQVGNSYQRTFCFSCEADEVYDQHYAQQCQSLWVHTSGPWQTFLVCVGEHQPVSCVVAAQLLALACDDSAPDPFVHHLAGFCNEAHTIMNKPFSHSHQPCHHF